MCLRKQVPKKCYPNLRDLGTLQKLLSVRAESRILSANKEPCPYGWGFFIFNTFKQVQVEMKLKMMLKQVQLRLNVNQN